MKNKIRIKVREGCSGHWFDIVLCDGKKILMSNCSKSWARKSAAIRNAKILAKQIGIPYSDEIFKIHGY